jgi:hypothetical protein
VIDLKKEMCENCANCYQHYALNSRKIYRVYCGHCCLRPYKKRFPDMVACQEYVPAPNDESSFVQKEYLSKELLQYMLKLELLPKIEGML